jgi:hypothetical protein
LGTGRVLHPRGRTDPGEYEFNKRSNGKELKPVSKTAVVPVPAIVDRETLNTVHALRKARHSHGDAVGEERRRKRSARSMAELAGHDRR